MKYVLLICSERSIDELSAEDQVAEQQPAEQRPAEQRPAEQRPAERRPAHAGLPIEEWVEQMDSSGIRQFGTQLRPPADATTVRVRDGELLLTDGPYAETKEWMAGFDIIECADLDEAIEVAAKHPMARGGMIEVRPFWDE